MHSVNATLEGLLGPPDGERYVIDDVVPVAGASQSRRLKDAILKDLQTRLRHRHLR